MGIQKYDVNQSVSKKDKKPHIQITIIQKRTKECKRSACSLPFMLQGTLSPLPTTFPEDGVFGFATVLWKDGVTVNDMIARCHPQRLERRGGHSNKGMQTSIGEVNP